jgi:hypothetical protein
MEIKILEANERIAFGLGELAIQLGVSTGFLRKQERLGHLKTTKLGDRKLVLVSDLENYLKGESDEQK